MGVRRPDEVDVADLVAFDVVKEDAFALDEPLVFLARDVLADKARLDVPCSTTSGRSGVTVISVIERPP